MTPRLVRVIHENNVLDFESSGEEAYFTEAGGVEGLPEFEAGTMLIVDKEISDAFPNRKDLLTPTCPVCNEAGQVIGYEDLTSNY